MRDDEGPSAENAGDRCPSGIEGLDDILGGGLPRDCFYLIQGDPGAGKTTLALQFLREGVRRGERVFYITLSETETELVKVARSHGWSLDNIPMLELSAIESLLRPEVQTTVFHPSEMELNKVTGLLVEQTRKFQPTRVVFDSLSEFRLMAETPLRYRRQLLNLKREFARQRATVLVLDDKMGHGALATDPHILSLSHGVLEMEQLSPDYGSSRRRLRVLKMRGVRFREGYHDYTIVTGGLRIFPRLVAAEHHGEFRGGAVRSGIEELDALLGGGLDRGTTTLILGAAGTGKSTLALRYATQMARQGESSIVFAFDESRGVLLNRCRDLGFGLEEHIKSGKLTIQQLDPAEISPGEFTSRIREGVEGGAKLVVIDSLNGYLNAMPGEKYLDIALHELCSYLNEQGVLTILILPQHGLVGPYEVMVDISYLADTVVSVRFFEAAGVVRRALSVIKKRSGQHELTIRELKIENGKGIRIGRALKEFHGILTGAPTFHGRADQMMKASDAGA